jgi:ubiquinone biosynthesis protein UbiJ
MPGRALGPVVAVLEDAGNRLLRTDPETLDRLGDLDGRVIAVQLTDLNLALRLLPSAGGLRWLAGEGEADVTLRGRAAAWVQLLAGRREVFSSGELTVEGDAALAQRLERALTGFRPDPEERLAHVIGDVPAHAVGNAVRAVGDFIQRARDAFARDAGEYLLYEKELLAPRHRVEDHLRAVDIARADVERLAARVARLNEQLAERPA